MRVLVVGGGAREHALCWRLARDPVVDRLFAAPGNVGMQDVATLVPTSWGDIPGLVEFAERESIDLTVVGPEAPLVAGLVDELQARGLAAFGPGREGARLEGSKAWARSLCLRHGIPAPASGAFDAIEQAARFLDELSPPYVVKADGLAGGKGVVIAPDRDEAVRALRASLLERVFGDAGSRVVVEEHLEGFEVSALAITDGERVLPLALAHDYKRAEDGDRGANTGGMGAYSPVERVGEKVGGSIVRDVLERTARALHEEGVSYRGVLYAGLMVTEDGPRVLEFNARFGDPETQALLPRVEGDLAQALFDAATGKLSADALSWSPESCVGVVLTSSGYPGTFAQGKVISGLEAAGSLPGVQVFHAGTAVREGRVVTAGGRVLTATALGSDLRDARDRAYEAAAAIAFEGKAMRRDIAQTTIGGTG